MKKQMINVAETIGKDLEGWKMVTNRDGKCVRIGHLATGIAWSQAGMIQARLNRLNWLNVQAAMPNLTEKTKDELLDRIKEAEADLESSKQLFEWAYLQASPELRPSTEAVLERFKPAPEQYESKIKEIMNAGGKTEEEARKIIGMKVDMSTQRFESVKDELAETLNSIIRDAQKMYIEDLLAGRTHEPPTDDDFEISMVDGISVYSKMGDKAAQYADSEIASNLDFGSVALINGCTNSKMLSELSIKHRAKARIWAMMIEAQPGTEDFEMLKEAEENASFKIAVGERTTL